MARPIPCRRISATSKFLAVKFYIERQDIYALMEKIIDSLLKAISPIVFLLLSIVIVWVIALFITPIIETIIHPDTIEEGEIDNETIDRPYR